MSKREVAEATTLPDPKCWVLPVGWSWVPFSDAAVIASNLVKPALVSHLPHIAPDNIESRTGRLLPYRSIAEDGVISAKHRFTTGQVLYSKIRPYLRKAVVAEFEGACSADMYPLTPREGVCAGYLHRWLISEPFAEFSVEHEGRTVLPKINQEGLNRTWMPLPPVPEQRRIVAKIDSLSSKSKRAREHLDHIPRLVEKYKQAVLAAAFRGELTREWRKARFCTQTMRAVTSNVRELSQASIPSDWKIASIGDAAENHDGRRIPIKAADRAKRRGEYPYYGASGAIDTIDDFLFDGEFLLVGEDGANLLSRSTPIAFIATGQFWVNNHAHVLKARAGTSNRWLCWFVNMIDLQPFVTGSAQPKLTQGALNGLDVPLPSLDEQAEIIMRIDHAFTWIDRLAAEATSARALIDRLDQAVLAKAFRGELVPHDPNDEPASVLLERIRAEREAVPAAKSRRGRARRS